MKIDPEQFEEWTAHPYTEALFRACDVLADVAKDAWVKRSWGSGSVDLIELATLRARAAALLEIRNITAEKLEDLTTP